MSLSILLILISLPELWALVGYDCGGSGFNISTIDLRRKEDCDTAPTKPEIRDEYIQLLQLSDFRETEVTQCKIEIDRMVYHCGMHSHISLMPNGRRQYITKISRETCMEIQKSGFVSLGSARLNEIQRNHTTTRGLLMAGSIKENGQCVGAYYDDGYGTWENAVVQGIAKITLMNYSGKIKLDDNLIVLESGFKCKSSDKYCFDDEGGDSFWNEYPIDTCKFDRYDVLYEGKASKLMDKQSRLATPTLYTLASEDVTFTLTKKGVNISMRLYPRHYRTPKTLHHGDNKG